MSPGSMLVENADLRSEGIGTRSMALRMNGDLTIADATVTALGDDAESTVGINIIPNQTVSGIEDRGTLTPQRKPVPHRRGHPVRHCGSGLSKSSGATTGHPRPYHRRS